MNDNFLKVFQQNLANEHFSSLTFYINNTNVISFSKQIGNNIYFILPTKENLLNYKEFFETYEKALREKFTNRAINKIFILELIICEKSNPELINYSRYNSIFSDDLIKLRWLVDLSEKLIIVQGKQANKFLNVSKVIKNSFNGKLNNQSMNKTLPKSEEDKIVNENIYLTLSIIATISFIHFYLKITGSYSYIVSFCSTTPTMLTDGEYYRILTSAFFHANLRHLLSNCLALYIFGSRVERYLGKINLFIIYIIGIMAGNIASNLLVGSYSIGASGGIFAVEGAILFYSLKSKRRFDGLDFSIIGLMVFMGIAMGFVYPDIDNTAHIGGLVSGILIGAIIYYSKRFFRKI